MRQLAFYAAIAVGKFPHNDDGALSTHFEQVAISPLGRPERHMRSTGGERLIALLQQPDATTAPPVAPTTAPVAAVTEAPTTMPPSGAVPIIVKEKDDEPPPLPEMMVNASETKWSEEFETNNPLMQSSIWGWIGPPILISLVLLVVLTINMLIVGSGPDDVQEDEIVLPENMYGEMFASILVAAHKTRRNGFGFGLACEIISSLTLLAVTYGAVLIMLQVAENTIGSVEQDVEERDSLFEKFRPPAIWMAQNWTAFPETTWRRESMVWFCHDIIYGKAKHVNELGETWTKFSWVVLVIWFSYMLSELRACGQLWSVTWDTPTVPVDQMVEEDEEEGDLKVHGISLPLKVLITALVVLPKLILNFTVAYVGAIFLMFNDLDDDLQEILLKTIEMAFILEMDELIFEAFASAPKKAQLEKIQLPIIRVKGISRVFSTYGELPRLVVILCIATCCALYMHQQAFEINVLTPKQSGVIEGCCNFMEYLKGAGQKTQLAEGNPCSSFREGYEEPMGVAYNPPAPSHAGNATDAAADPGAVGAAGAVVAQAMLQYFHKKPARLEHFKERFRLWEPAGYDHTTWGHHHHHRAPWAM